MRKYILMTSVAMAVAGMSAVASAADDDFILGKESKGGTVQHGSEFNMKARVRLQPRWDYGDLTTETLGGVTSFATQSDLYIRRARLEIGGNLTKALTYGFVLEADKSDQKSTSGATTKLHYAYFNYKFDDAFSVRVGKEKLPYSRVSLTSSSKQLLVERPLSTEAAKKFFGNYYQTNVMLHGKLADGMFNYYADVADGVNGGANTRGGPALIGRIELSPPGFVEKGKSDAHLGKGQHMTLGLSYGSQQGAGSATGTADYTLQGLDLSGHWQGLTAQAEYIEMKTESSTGSVTKPKGWYVQAGYFIPGINLEPAFRYENYDHDSNKANQTQKITTLGANYYLKGHSMKVGLNWVHHKFDTPALAKTTNDTSANVVQLQTQFYF